MTQRSALTAKYANAAEKPRAGQPLTPEKEALIVTHLPQVKYIAERIGARLPASVDRDDLVGAGVMGLIDAVEKYDEARGVQFKTYAETRIRGAILDSLREMDWSSRGLRSRAREIEKATRRIEQEKGRMAEEEELAEAMGMGLTAFQQLLGELRGLTVVDIDNKDEDPSGAKAFQIPESPDRSPLVEFEREENRERLVNAINRLGQRERQVIALYYVEELTMKETGAVLGLTESRVSQIHTRALIHLRAALSKER